MPMNKDLPRKNEAQNLKSAADFTTERQQARSGHGPKHIDAVRPSTPQGDLTHATEGLVVDDNNGSLNSKPVAHTKSFSVSVQQRRETFNPHKISLSGLPPKNPRIARNSPSQPQGLHPNQEKSNSNIGAEKQKPVVRHPTSAFDDTASFEASFLNDSNLDAERTVILRPQLPSVLDLDDPIRPLPDSYDEHNLNRDDDRTDLARAIGGEDWQAELLDERRYRNRKLGSTPNITRDQSAAGLSNNNRGALVSEMFSDLDVQPETPSRTQSVPPRTNLPAPVPRNPNKTVGFAPTPDFFGDNQNSPAFRSADIEREDNDNDTQARLNNAEATPTHLVSQQQLRSLQDRSNGRFQQVHASLNAHSSRFPKMAHHQKQTTQQDEKVSAPDSDIQDSSEDESRNMKLRRSVKDDTLVQPQDMAATSRKRSFDEINELDYDVGALKHKTLSELRGESFNKDPREPDRMPIRDNHGNDMNLSQVLDSLTKMTPEAQREIFRTQTDEEWSQTGQWFIDRFQTHLKDLTQVRLERRKTAMRFEDKIRRRHREVEHRQASVQKELNELQEGGHGLLKDRKMGGGSRSATPVKTGRPG